MFMSHDTPYIYIKQAPSVHQPSAYDMDLNGGSSGTRQRGQSSYPNSGRFRNTPSQSAQGTASTSIEVDGD